VEKLDPMLRNVECLRKIVREGDHLGDPSVDGRIILKWIFKTWDRGMD
jgi:hypothetical protein